jgi:uncharacterized protein (TIGR02246 family)
MKTLLLCVSLAVCNSVFAFESPQALQDAFLAALRANDVESMAACYTPDATTFTPDTMMGIGPDSVRASWGGLFKKFHVTSAESADGHMEISGDLAVAWGLFTITAEPLAGGDAIIMKGRYMDAAKNIDGQWLYIADHASMPMPPAPEQ